jgi:hypothetical protein
MVETIEINRAPVLTLWGAVVAERLGHDHEAALTLGKAMAGLNAQAKGRSLGVFGPRAAEADAPAAKSGLGEDGWVTLCGRPVPVRHMADGIRAVVRDQPIEPAKVRAYLTKEFGEALEDVRSAMAALADAVGAPDIEARSYALYERFRPAIPAGRAGWGAKGVLDVKRMRAMAADLAARTGAAAQP